MLHKAQRAKLAESEESMQAITITAQRQTSNAAWAKTLHIRLVSTPDNGYWWQGYRADGDMTPDVVLDANALAPGRHNKRGYAKVKHAIGDALNHGWTVTQQ